MTNMWLQPICIPNLNNQTMLTCTENQCFKSNLPAALWTHFHCSFLCQHIDGPKVLKCCVYTSTSGCNNNLPWQMYHLINTSDLELEMCLQSVPQRLPCGVSSSRNTGGSSVLPWQYLFQHPLCGFHVNPTPDPSPCPWAWLLPSHCRPPSWVHADLWTLPHLWGPATDPVHWLQGRKEHKTESCPSSLVTPGGCIVL